jgi:glycosyltransferase involved in cell wall biosynthesis
MAKGNVVALPAGQECGVPRDPPRPGIEVKVSIITACYNSARTIAAALESVASQSYPGIEHVVVDGGSTDGTLQVVRAHGARIARVIHGPDRGIYDALNKGVAASSGDVVAFLHSDDVYRGPGVIEEVVQRMSAESLDTLYGDVAFVRGDDLDRVVRVYSSRHFRPSRLAWGWMPAHPALFVSRELFRRYGLFKIDYAIAGDFEFVARIFANPALRYAYVPRIFVKMRMGGSSTKGLKSTLILNREVLRACRENGIPSNYLKILSKYPAKALELLVRAGQLR